MERISTETHNFLLNHWLGLFVIVSEEVSPKEKSRSKVSYIVVALDVPIAITFSTHFQRKLSDNIKLSVVQHNKPLPALWLKEKPFFCNSWVVAGRVETCLRGGEMSNGKRLLCWTTKSLA